MVGHRDRLCRPASRYGNVFFTHHTVVRHRPTAERVAPVHVPVPVMGIVHRSACIGLIDLSRIALALHDPSDRLRQCGRHFLPCPVIEPARERSPVVTHVVNLHRLGGIGPCSFYRDVGIAHLMGSGFRAPTAEHVCSVHVPVLVMAVHGVPLSVCRVHRVLLALHVPPVVCRQRHRILGVHSLRSGHRCVLAPAVCHSVVGHRDRLIYPRSYYSCISFNFPACRSPSLKYVFTIYISIAVCSLYSRILFCICCKGITITICCIIYWNFIFIFYWLRRITRPLISNFILIFGPFRCICYIFGYTFINFRCPPHK